MAIQITQSDKDRLINIINEGVKVNQEIDDLREGLRETVKAIAEELEIKPSLLNKAIRIAQKGDWNLKQDEMDDLEAILTATGRN
tara:strand:+ start:253 stop:507 length:255 start_codon:yes stop_codon:yes gene_type:complete